MLWATERTRYSDLARSELHMLFGGSWQEKKRGLDSKRVVVTHCGKGDDIQVSVSSGRKGDHRVELEEILRVNVIRTCLQWALDEKKDEMVVIMYPRRTREGSNHDRAAAPTRETGSNNLDRNFHVPL